MGLDLRGGHESFKQLEAHVGHKIEVVSYDANVAIECETCGCVLVDFDICDDDEFICEGCSQVFDIEDSIKKNEMLFCPNCAERVNDE